MGTLATIINVRASATELRKHTCCIPETKIDRFAIYHHICRIIIKPEVCVCVCVCVCVSHVYMCTCMYCVCTCLCVCKCVYVYVYVLCMHMCVQMCIDVCEVRDNTILWYI